MKRPAAVGKSGSTKGRQEKKKKRINKIKRAKGHELGSESNIMQQTRKGSMDHDAEDCWVVV
jgi:hypothetical protein